MIALTGNTWERWRQLHADLAATGKWKLAGLFMGTEGAGFQKQGNKRVLYTGKATAGSFEPKDSNDAAELYVGLTKSAFWHFAERLNRLAGGREPLEFIAWSNLFKIGVEKGNPSDGIVKEQWQLAVETLEQEWQELKPTLVVCVTEGYYEELIYQVLGVERGPGDHIQETKRAGVTYWVRPALNGMPALLWMKHPQGKTREYLQGAEELAAELLAGRLPPAQV